MAWTLCSLDEAEQKAGLNVNSAVVDVAATTTAWSEQTEGLICTESKYDWVTNYASLQAEFKNILREAASAHAAMKMVAYDMSGYTSVTEAQTMLNVLYDQYRVAMDLLKQTQFSIKVKP